MEPVDECNPTHTLSPAQKHAGSGARNENEVTLDPPPAASGVDSIWGIWTAVPERERSACGPHCWFMVVRRCERPHATTLCGSVWCTSMNRSLAERIVGTRSVQEKKRSRGCSAVSGRLLLEHLVDLEKAARE